MWLIIKGAEFGRCYVLILGHEIGMKKIQKYKNFVCTLVKTYEISLGPYRGVEYQRPNGLEQPIHSEGLTVSYSSFQLAWKIVEIQKLDAPG